MGKRMTLKSKGQFQNNQPLHRKKEAVEYLTSIRCGSTSVILGSDWTNFWRNNNFMTAMNTPCNSGLIIFMLSVCQLSILKCNLMIDIESWYWSGNLAVYSLERIYIAIHKIIMYPRVGGSHKDHWSPALCKPKKNHTSGRVVLPPLPWGTRLSAQTPSGVRTFF